MVDRRSVPLFLIIALLASSSAVVLTYSVLTKTLTTRGTLAVPPSPTLSMGFYSDKNCTVPTTSIDWGVLPPGSTKTCTIYLRNEGDVGWTLQSINMTNVNPPEMSKYLSLTTDYDGRTVSPNQVLTLALTLQVTSGAQGTGFTFDIVISFG